MTDVYFEMVIIVTVFHYFEFFIRAKSLIIGSSFEPLNKKYTTVDQILGSITFCFKRMINVENVWHTAARTG